MVLAFAFIAVLYVHYHHKRWTGDEDELQGPQSDVGNGEEVVIADVCAARLLGVAVKVFLLIVPNSLSRYNVNHHPEHKNDWEPDPTKCSGVFIHPTEQCLKSFPIHGSEQGQVTLGVLWSSLTLNISDEEYSNLKMEKPKEEKINHNEWSELIQKLLYLKATWWNRYLTLMLFQYTEKVKFVKGHSYPYEWILVIWGIGRF